MHCRRPPTSTRFFDDLRWATHSLPRRSHAARQQSSLQYFWLALALTGRYISHGRYWQIRMVLPSLGLTQPVNHNPFSYLPCGRSFRPSVRTPVHPSVRRFGHQQFGQSVGASVLFASRALAHLSSELPRSTHLSAELGDHAGQSASEARRTASNTERRLAISAKGVGDRGTAIYPEESGNRAPN